MEIHWFESSTTMWTYMNRDNWRPVLYCEKETLEAIYNREPIIYTTQKPALFTASPYYIYLHYANGAITKFTPSVTEKEFMTNH